MTIKAIETVYNGYRFRSRLEARWAVFFDAFGFEYSYEPEGFDLGEAGYYLPDFYLPSIRSYVEIKPGPLNDEEKRKLVALNDDPPEGAFGAIALIGLPSWPSFEWAKVDGERRVIGWKNSMGLLLHLLESLNPPGDQPADSDAIDFIVRGLRNAIDAARQARFEHGEQPVTAEMLEAV